MRRTIDFGIDLGTTNSSIAVLKGTETMVIKNNENDEVTLSAIWVTRQGQIFVGKRAKHQPDAAMEFKLSMGTNRIWRFGQRTMTPEELSSEVLKALRSDVQQRLGEDITTAVIGVPADFDLTQCKATERAARMAGFETVMLVQEPVAAALAYTFQSDVDRVLWLVYDLGGGTFDAAIVSVREGTVNVVTHTGDRNLGGKLIDGDIVDHIFIPALKSQYSLGSLNRADERAQERWKALLHQLKLEAEQVKIRLSRDLVTVALPPNNPIGVDERGEPIWLELEVTRKQIEAFVKPKVERTIAIVRRMLEEKRLRSDDLERVILVGGPTLTPLLREMVQDELGVPLAFYVDPMTVVARGAAIFAGAQLAPQCPTVPVTLPKLFTVELVYKPIDSTTEPLVGGKIIASSKQALDGFTVEFVEIKSQWRSGKIPVQPNGAFIATLKAEKGRQNEFVIELHDKMGTAVEVMPNRFTYTVGQTLGTQILTHHVGVALATGDVELFFEKGTPLHAKATKRLRTTQDLHKGQAETMLRIPIVEGNDMKRADRNREIGVLEVRGDSARVWRDIPSGTELQVTMEIDEERLVKVRAFVPLLEDEFEAEMHLERMQLPPEKLRQMLEAEKARLERVRGNVLRTNNTEAMRRLHELENAHVVEGAEGALQVGATEPDAADRCYDLIVELRHRLDEVEEAMALDVLVLEAQDTLDRVRYVVNAYGSTEMRSRLQALEQQLHDAIARRNEVQVRRCMNELTALELEILREQPWFWVVMFDHLSTLRHKMRDRREAEQLFHQGANAIQRNDLEGLQQTVIQLIQLLPREEQIQVISTVVRA